MTEGTHKKPVGACAQWHGIVAHRQDGLIAESFGNLDAADLNVKSRSRQLKLSTHGVRHHEAYTDPQRNASVNTQKKFIDLAVKERSLSRVSRHSRATLRIPPDLPLPLSEILDVDAVVVTHTHQDHWDDAAIQAPKTCLAHAECERPVGSKCHGSATRCWRATFWRHHVNKTPAGRGETRRTLGDIRTFAASLFTHPREKTLYIAGDTVSASGGENLKQYKPDVMVSTVAMPKCFLMNPSSWERRCMKPIKRSLAYHYASHMGQ